MSLPASTSLALTLISLPASTLTLPLMLPTVLPACSTFWLSYWSLRFSLPMVKPKPPLT